MFTGGLGNAFIIVRNELWQTLLQYEECIVITV